MYKLKKNKKNILKGKTTGDIVLESGKYIKV